MITLYFMEIDGRTDSSLMQALVPLISHEKRRQVERMRVETDRKLSVYSEGLLRILACEMLRVKNGDLKFAENESGKPYLPEHAAFHFNISHTRNALAVAVSDLPVGVDIEKMNSADPYAARKVFTAGEFKYVFSGENAENDETAENGENSKNGENSRNDNAGENGASQPSASGEDIRFNEIWTRKEAFMKWNGTGWPADISCIDVLSDPSASKIVTLQINRYVLSVCSAADNVISGIVTMTEHDLLSKMNDIII